MSAQQVVTRFSSCQRMSRMTCFLLIGHLDGHRPWVGLTPTGGCSRIAHAGFECVMLPDTVRAMQVSHIQTMPGRLLLMLLQCCWGGGVAAVFGSSAPDV